MKRLLIAAAAALALTACTPEQLTTYSQVTGHQLSTTDFNNLLTLPDVPMRLTDGRMIHPDGTVTTPTIGGRCAEWYGMALAAGFTHAQWLRLAPIMYRESRCQPGAYNRHGGASGLLQIMPMWAKSCGIGRAQLLEAWSNLRCGVYILRVQGWQAWAL
jgi:hypothetical protein